MIKDTKSKPVGSKLFDVINIVLMVLFCVTIILPIWNMIVVSVLSADMASVLSFNLLPREISLDSYRYCLQEINVYNAFIISIFRTVAGTLIHIIITALVAYPLSKLDIPFRKILLLFFLISMFFGGGIIPTFIIIRKIGLINNLLVYILPLAFSPFSMLILRNYFMSIDKSIEESAIIDGATVTAILLRIIMPICKPVLATITLWHMVFQWNSWFDSLIYIRDENKIVLQLLLRRMIDQTELISSEMFMEYEAKFNTESVKAAITVIVLTPVVCVYPFLQKYFVKGIMLGAVKG